jgi:4'-phosphopantetheinyl transferase
MVSIFKVFLAQLKNIPTERIRNSLDEGEGRELATLIENQHKTRYMESVFLKKVILSKYLKVTMEAVHLGEQKLGKPTLISPKNSLDFNVAHSNDLFVCAIADSGLIGVDVEEIKEIDLRTALEFCCDSELAYLNTGNDIERRINFFKLWTLKEAYVKAIGKGLSYPLKDICFNLMDLSSVKIEGNASKKWLFDINKVDNYILSICTSEKIDKNYIVHKDFDLNDF